MVKVFTSIREFFVKEDYKFIFNALEDESTERIELTEMDIISRDEGVGPHRSRWESRKILLFKRDISQVGDEFKADNI